MTTGSAMPSLEGVVVVGMHRSGTSLVTRLVNLLGLNICRANDLLVGGRANPRGHWESKAMSAFNGRLLSELGGTWFCPPPLGSVDVASLLDRHAAAALAELRRAHPDRPFVWKDPRTCLLLPFWSAVLERRVAYVMVARHPLDVSRSLERRDGLAPPLGLALWERYTREATLGAAGRPVLLCTYEQVLAGPVAWCERLSSFLGSLGVQTRAVERTAVEALTAGGPGEASRSWSDLQPSSLFSPQRIALARVASAPSAQASYDPPALPGETPETESIFAEIRPNLANARRGAPLLAAVPRHLSSRAATRADAPQSRRPPVSFVLARDDASREAPIAAIADTLPDGSEILVLGAPRADADGAGAREQVSVRCVECPRSASAPEALARGVQQARGAVVLLSGASTLPGGWSCEQLGRAVRRDLVGGVAPVMRSQSRPSRRHLGRAFVDEDLTARSVIARRASRLRAPRGADGLLPAALLSDGLCAFDREVLTAAGGVDGHFSSATSAIAELSVRLWRMGFPCFVAAGVEAWGEAADTVLASDALSLHDRLRIATLHFGPARLRAFTERASQLPGFQEAAARVAASDVRVRRAAIDAVCAFSIDRYLEEFPLRRSVRSTLRGGGRRLMRRARQSHFLRARAVALRRARAALMRHKVRG